MPIEDEDCSTQLERALKARGMKCYTGTEVSEAHVTKTGVALALKKPDGITALEVSRVLVATGRRPVLEGQAETLNNDADIVLLKPVSPMQLRELTLRLGSTR